MGKIIGFDVVGDGVELIAKAKGMVGGRVKKKVWEENNHLKLKDFDLHEVSILSSRQVTESALKLRSSGIIQERNVKPAVSSKPVAPTLDQVP